MENEINNFCYLLNLNKSKKTNSFRIVVDAFKSELVGAAKKCSKRKFFHFVP